MKKLLQLTGVCALMLGFAVSCNDPIDPTPDELAAPTGLAVGTLTTTTADLSWSAVTGAESYNVQVGDKAAVNVTATQHQATELTMNTAYTWKVQAVKGDVVSAWTDGSGFTTLNDEPTPTTPVPTGLTATEVTHNAALLSWSHADADKHEVVVGDGTAVETTTLSYQATGLTPETAYTWKVRSSKDNVWSEWADGPAFTTEAESGGERIQLLEVFLDGYYEDFYGAGTSNFGIFFHNYYYATDGHNGYELGLDIISTGVDDSSTVEHLHIPAGTYTFNTSGAAGSVLIGDYTYIVSILDGTIQEELTITGGTMIVSGNGEGYTFKFDIEHAGGQFLADFTGPLEIDNPNYIPDSDDVLDLGTLSGMIQCGYNADPWGIGIDVWLISAIQSPGVYVEGGYIVGTGWFYRLQTHVNSGGSTTVMPDGVYTIDRTNGSMTAFGGNGTNGMSITRLDAGSAAETKYLASGTVTSAYTNGAYKIDVDAIATDGVNVKLSVQAAPPAAAPRMMPSNQDYWRPYALAGAQKADVAKARGSKMSSRAR